MTTTQEPAPGFREIPDSWLARNVNLTAPVVTFIALLARLWTASGTFLNPDEALHFRLANQPSLAVAYQESLTASHPPLLTFILYFWRGLGTSELWLRLPLIIASVAFCWMFYKWLANAAGYLAAFIGLLFVAFLPPIILLSSEIRQYPLMLAFLASALYFLDEAFAKNSSGSMAAFTLCLYLAMFSHYSAFFFAAALGVYAILRFYAARPPSNILAVWTIGQVGALALAIFFYKTHLSKLGVGESRTVLQGWMSEFYLRRSYFDPTRDNPLLFVVGHTFGVFQFFFGQLVVGDAMGGLFIIGAVLLLRGKGFAHDRDSSHRTSSRQLGIFLLLLCAIAAAASLAHLYPFGGTRHVAFLIIPGIAGVSVALVRLTTARQLSANSPTRALAITAAILIVCIAFGKPRRPRMDRADQSIAHMAAAIDFVQNHIAPSDLIFVDYQTDLVLGHYLCHQHPIMLDAAPTNFEQFSCGARRVVSTDYKTEKISWQDFPRHWQEFVEAYNLKASDTVWIVQSAWDVTLPEDLRTHYSEFHDLQFQSFGDNIKIFNLTAGQPMPQISLR
jgi:hypothetical protein